MSHVTHVQTTFSPLLYRGDAAQRVAKLHDQYLAFIALEPTIFSLGLPEAYVQLNDPSAQDSQIEVRLGVGGWEGKGGTIGASGTK